MSKMNLLESIFVSGATARNEVLWVGKLQRLPRLRALEKSSESEMGRKSKKFKQSFGPSHHDLTFVS